MENQGISWQYDEFKQIGTDYSSKTEVDKYDSSHADFRDIKAESIKVLDLLEVTKEHTLIDFGSGTGTFAIEAALRCARVHAVDVSREMIDCAATKAMKAGVTNLHFHHAGFLTYRHQVAPVDAVVTTFAFHHLPDFWKGIALKRVNAVLKPSGKFYIHDVIIEENQALKNIAALIQKLGKAGGKLMREDAERHFKDEYSTYDWVMDGLLARAGFTIRVKRIEDGVLGTYICTRN
ncbi:SAM-dependent methyltransferase, type 18 [Geotalea daltonii FRC-32]|uniref:SAM-dependent methyltransferase, type 18 n=1 Tax=Geotalea daltonii (strain DSM 22248 / JCM 15807 / FRC-32) TaxID=316067 RepID=B9M8P5_GEODF|nr:class I SAM-dependent methyltransferase [Geotalea daltonii]ACM20391.1 SAM-dependent methyltransferase, type 18 [Geotalea daltonii FRC-32]